MGIIISSDIVVERPAIYVHVEHITGYTHEDDWESLVTKSCDLLRVEFRIKEGEWAGFSDTCVDPYYDDETSILTLGSGYHKYKGQTRKIRIDLKAADMAEVKALFAAQKERKNARLRREAEVERQYQEHYQTVMRALDSEEPVETTEELLRRISQEDAAQVMKEN